MAFRAKKLTTKEMFSAIKSNPELARQSLFSWGMPNNIHGINEHTLMRTAIEYGRTELVTLMIQKRCSVAGDSYRYYSPLQLAIVMQNIDIVKILLQSGASIEETREKEQTPLHYAVKSKQMNIILLLLQRGANWEAVDSDGLTVLHYAIKYCVGCFFNDRAPKVKSGTPTEIMEILDVFVSMGMEVDVASKSGETPMHFAINRKMKDVIEYLLVRSAKLYLRMKNGDSAIPIVLHDVLNLNYIIDPYYRPSYQVAHKEILKDEDKAEFIDWLISKGAIIDFHDRNKQTPLQIAILYNLKETTRVLLKHTTNFINCDNDGNNVLHVLLAASAKKGNSDKEEIIELLKILLQKGAEVDILNKRRESPIHIAIKNNQKKLLSILLPHSNLNFNDEHESLLYNFVEKNVKNNALELKETMKLIKLLLAKGASVNYQKKNSDTPIYLAARCEQKEMARLLLPNFTSVDASSSCIPGDTILHLLLKVCDDQDQDHIEIIQSLLSQGANVNIQNFATVTALHLAAVMKLKEIANLLISHGADVQICSVDGQTVLHYLMHQNTERNKFIEKDMVRLFVDHGCSVNTKTIKGMTPLHLAAQSGRYYIAEGLIEQGADINTTEPLNLSMPIHLAAQNNHGDIIELLIRYGADVNARRKLGKTPLHIAAQQDNEKSLRILLSNNADVNAVDNDGKTPLHDACWTECTKSIEILLENGGNIYAKDIYDQLPETYVVRLKDEVQVMISTHEEHQNSKRLRTN